MEDSGGIQMSLDCLESPLKWEFELVLAHLPGQVLSYGTILQAYKNKYF